MFTGGGYLPHLVWYGWSGSGAGSSTNHKALSELRISATPPSSARPRVGLGAFRFQDETILTCTGKIVTVVTDRERTFEEAG